MTDGSPSGSEFRPPVKDPWAGLRGIMAGTLIMEALVMLLALPVIATVGGGLTWLSGGYVGLLALAMIFGAGRQRRSWATPYNIAVQLGMILGFFVHPAIGVLGLLFAAVWAYFLYLRKDLTYRIEHGLLPGQRD